MYFFGKILCPFSTYIFPAVNVRKVLFGIIVVKSALLKSIVCLVAKAIELTHLVYDRKR